LQMSPYGSMIIHHRLVDTGADGRGLATSAPGHGGKAMSFLAEHAGVLRPEDISTLRNVYGRIVSEPWVSKDPNAREEFAKYMLSMYQRGLSHHDKLLRFGLVAAKHRLADQALSESMLRD
jgi:hypothetical protein